MNASSDYTPKSSGQEGYAAERKFLDEAKNLLNPSPSPTEGTQMSLATHCIPYDPDCSICNPIRGFRGEDKEAEGIVVGIFTRDPQPTPPEGNAPKGPETIAYAYPETGESFLIRTTHAPESVSLTEPRVPPDGLTELRDALDELRQRASVDQYPALNTVEQLFTRLTEERDRLSKDLWLAGEISKARAGISDKLDLALADNAGLRFELSRLREKIKRLECDECDGTGVIVHKSHGPWSDTEEPCAKCSSGEKHNG